MKKQFILFFLIFLPLMARADAVEIDGICYNLVFKAKIAEVTSNSNGYSGEIVIPEIVSYDGLEYSVTSIGSRAFYGCSGLTSVTIPNSVTSIGSSAFSFCSGLTSVTIPNSVTSIGDYAFWDCSGLTSITIPNSVTFIDDYAFSSCTGLTSVTIPNSVISISGGSFSFCTGLTSITIPNSVTFIDNYAFFGCSDLTSVTIPNSMTSIGNNSFGNCSKLTDVYCYAETVPYADNDAFKDSYPEYMILHVPEGKVDAYKAAEPWNQFKDIILMNFAKYTLTYMVDGEVYKTYEVYEGTTIVPETEPTKEGYEFSGWSTIPSTMPAEDVTITGTFKVQADEDVIKITSVGQTTWCSKYDLDFTDIEGLKAYTAGGYHRTKGTIWLMRVYEVPAGEGILLIGDEGEYKVPHKSTTAYYANLMVGTVKAITINETDGEYTNYYLSNGASGVGFYKVNGSVDIKANRAYLPLLKNTESGSRGFIGMDFDDDEDGTTGISEAQQRVGEQDVYYNLQGQRVDNPSKGIYIRNGKKVVIK